MKKIIIFLLLVLITASIYAQEPQMKIYLDNGSTRVYNIEELDSINFIHKDCDYVLRIHQDVSTIYYPTEIISKINIEKYSIDEYIHNIYIYFYPHGYLLNSIDSLTFYIDKYQPLTICDQVWMLKNLDVATYCNGDTIPMITDSTQWANLTTGACCYYDNDPSNGKIYGKLYNWYAVNDPRGLAPKGWKVANNDDWLQLYNCLEPEVGKKIKSTGTINEGDGFWYSPNEATNESGFSAHPGGFRYIDGAYWNKGYYCKWWTATEKDMYYSYYWDVYNITSNLHNNHYKKGAGLSVRCVKDE